MKDSTVFALMVWGTAAVVAALVIGAIYALHHLSIAWVW